MNRRQDIQISATGAFSFQGRFLCFKDNGLEQIVLLADLTATKAPHLNFATQVAHQYKWWVETATKRLKNKTGTAFQKIVTLWRVVLSPFFVLCNFGVI